MPETETESGYALRIGEKRFDRAAGGDLLVIRDLRFTLPAQSFTCMLGPSGADKTTTLRIMLGLDTEFRGALSPALARARKAVMFQEPRLLPWRSVEQNIRLALPPGLKHKDLAPVLAAMDLDGFRSSYPAELSLGMARRAALARAFSVEPEILLLDEPFVSLDEATANRLRDLLVELWRASGITVLMVTHNLREAARLADRLVVLSGRPARVEGVVDVPLPREERSGPKLEALLMDMVGRFPALSAG